MQDTCDMATSSTVIGQITVAFHSIDAIFAHLKGSSGFSFIKFYGAFVSLNFLINKNIFHENH